MQFKDVVGLIVLVLLVSLGALIATRSSNRKPPEKYFRCGRCNTMTPHSARTIQAWRNEKTRFFCRTCHRKWLESQPPRPRDDLPRSDGYRAYQGYRGRKSSFADKFWVIVALTIGCMVVRACAG
jgi:hypothetical protein